MVETLISQGFLLDLLLQSHIIRISVHQDSSSLLIFCRHILKKFYSLSYPRKLLSCNDYTCIYWLLLWIMWIAVFQRTIKQPFIQKASISFHAMVRKHQKHQKNALCLINSYSKYITAYVYTILLRIQLTDIDVSSIQQLKQIKKLISRVIEWP